MTQKTYNFHPASGTNVNTTLAAYPKGTGSTDNKSEFLIYGTDYLSDQTNYDFATFRATGSSFYLSSGKSGTGTLRPLIFSAGYASGSGNTNQLYLDTNGNIGIGTTAPASPLTVTATISAAGVTAATINQAAHTAITANVPALTLSAASPVISSGATISRTSWLEINAPTYIGVAGGSAETITDAFTLYIDSAPIQGADATISNSWALGIGGKTKLATASSGTQLLLYTGTTLRGSLGISTGGGIYTNAVEITSQTTVVTVPALIPNTNNLRELGDSTARWSTIYGNVLDIASVASASGATAATIAQASHTAITTNVPALTLSTASPIISSGATITRTSWLEIAAPTYVGVAGGGAETISDAATLYIDGAPIQGADATLTRKWAAWIDSGNVRIDGAITSPSGIGKIICDDVVGTRLTYGGTTLTFGTNAIFTAVNVTDKIGFFTLSPTATFDFNTFANTSGTPIGLSFTGAAHTGQTASTEVPQVNINIGQTYTWSTGAITAQNFVKIAQPTIAFAGDSTVSDTSTFYIAGAPVQGSHATLTRTWSMWVDAGDARFDGKMLIGTGALTPAQQLHVSSGASTSYVEVEGTAGVSYFGNDSNGNCVIQSGTSGKDIYFYNQAGGTPIAVIDHLGNWLMAGATPGTNAANVLVLSNTATAPTTSTDITQLFSKDISAGNATLAIVTETAVAADAALVSTDSLIVWINGVKYKIMLVAA